jgi:GDPmannose 4,6-dehydratase
LGDASRARDKLGWQPKITFEEMVAEMVCEDLKSAERDEVVKKHGYRATKSSRNTATQPTATMSK